MLTKYGDEFMRFMGATHYMSREVMGMKVNNKYMVALIVCVLLFANQSFAFAATTTGSADTAASGTSATANQNSATTNQTDAIAGQTAQTADKTSADQVSAASTQTSPSTQETLIWLRPEYEGYHLLFMESIDLPTTAQLPFEIKAALPKGAVISWVGEVNRTDPTKDVEAQYKINHKTNYDEIVFTLQHNTAGQIEAQWVDGLKITGDKRVINLDWTQYYPTNSVSFLFRQPDNSTDIKISPLNASMQKGPDGSSFYQTEPIALSVGEKQQLTITYNRSQSATQQDMQGQSQGTGSSTNNQDNSTFLMIFGTIVLGLVLAGLVFRTKRDSGEDDENDDDDEVAEEDNMDVDDDESDADF
jgi:hypothetical protein